MYGQNLDYQNPAVRAILLEMQRRKVDFGADGVRVDGAQDFKWWDAATQELRHDDDYLQEMADIVQEVAGTATARGSSSRTAAPGPRRTGSCPRPTAP
jgi:glycosidase